MATRMPPSQPRWFQTIHVGGIDPIYQGLGHEVSKPCTNSGPAAKTTADGKIVSAPTAAECFVSGLPMGSSMPAANEFIPGNFADFYRGSVSHKAGMPQGKRNSGVFPEGMMSDKLKLFLTMPVAPEEVDGNRVLERQVKDITDVFNVYTLIQSQEPKTCYCNCGMTRCDTCCGKPNVVDQQFFTPLCLGQLTFCKCDGACHCEGALVIDPYFMMNGIYVALCTEASGPYITRVVAQGFDCCD